MSKGLKKGQHRAANHMGCLVSKGEGKPYLARWVFQGKIYTKSTGETDRYKAERALERITRPYRGNSKEEAIEALKRQIEKLESEIKTNKKKLFFSDLWTEFEPTLWDSNLSDGSLRSLKTAINTLGKWLSENKKLVQRVDQLTVKDAEDYLRWLSEKKAVGTYNMYIDYYRRIWKAMSKEWKLNAELWNNFKRKPKALAHKRRILTGEEIEKLDETVKGDSEMELMFALGKFAGMRQGDAAQLEWTEINWETGEIVYYPGKTVKTHLEPTRVPMVNKLREMLQARVVKSEGYVSDRNARDYKTGAMVKKLNEIFTKAGIEICSVDKNGVRHIDTGFHAFRHLFSSRTSLVLSGLQVSKMMGHSTIAQTSDYTHVMTEENRKKMEAILGGK